MLCTAPNFKIHIHKYIYAIHKGMEYEFLRKLKIFGGIMNTIELNIIYGDPLFLLTTIEASKDRKSLKVMLPGLDCLKY